MNSVLNQMDQVQTFIIFFCLQISIIIHSLPKTFMWYLLFPCFRQEFGGFSELSHADSIHLIFSVMIIQLSSLFFLQIFTLKDDTKALSRNIENRLCTKAASCVRRTESSSTSEVLYSKNPVFKKYERKKKFKHLI